MAKRPCATPTKPAPAVLSTDVEPLPTLPLPVLPLPVLPLPVLPLPPTVLVEVTMLEVPLSPPVVTIAVPLAEAVTLDTTVEVVAGAVMVESLAVLPDAELELDTLEETVEAPEETVAEAEELDDEELLTALEVVVAEALPQVERKLGA